ncbi:MAG TPA: sugar transferase [Gemmatimonadaceae bacterium]|nr:sugar transferase [Gemmatimonadaceae bacterium]
MASRGADTQPFVTGSFPVFETAVPTVQAPAAKPGSSRLRAVLASDALNRVLNFSIAAVALVMLAPVLLVIAIAVKLTSQGPIIYRQTRVGVDRRLSGGDRRGDGERRNAGPRKTDGRAADVAAAPVTDEAVERRAGAGTRGRRADGRRAGDRRAVDVGGRAFTMYKFRTMTVNAEATGAVWAAKNDARITPIGGLLRGTRLDEIPQLVNVLKGDMNIVGPRPERPSIFHQLRKEIDRYQLRQRAKPGITGWAQINQNYDTSIDDVRRKVEYDLAYIERRSVVEDMRIMAKTLPVMIFRKGAH